MTRWVAPIIVAALAFAATCARAQVILNEDFEGAASLAERGWTVEAEPEQSEWPVADGVLSAVCHRNPYKGGRIVREVPVIQRGVLELDCLFAYSGGVNYDHLSLGLKLYGHMMAFKKYGGHNWMVYRPEEKTWYTVTDRVPLGEWAHLRMEFDIPRTRVEYFLGDDPDPLFIDTRLPMAPDGATGELELFNYGLTKGTVTHRVDNIVLRGLGPEDGTAEARGERALVFRGMTSERYRAAEALSDTLGPERVSVYTMEARGAATTPRNKLALDRVPGAATWRDARWVVLEDCPAGPGECLPAYLLDDLEAAVRGGASLLVLGGPFSLGKGAWQGTPLAAMLPVQIAGPWELRRFDAPVALSGCEGAGLLWYHDAPLADGATPGALTAAGTPMVASKQLGAGRVTVFLGAPLGDPGDFGEVEPFWEWDGWPQLLRSLARIEAGGAQ